MRVKRPRSSSQSAAVTIAPTPERTLSPTTNTCLPFMELDRQSNPWVDGAPPTRLIRGRKRSDPIKTLKMHPPVTYAGWVSLREPISRMIIYGDMEGIRFSYATRGRPDSCFGNTAASLPQEKRVYKPKRPFRAIAQVLPKRGAGDVSFLEQPLPPIRVR